MSSWLRQLANPPSAFRGAPFWAWNAKLDSRELVRQVGEFQKAGLGGFFMHVRYGLETDYMSPEFMGCIKDVVAEARKRKMEAWLYDEDRWPSGFGGGMVTRNPEYRIKFLFWDAVPAAEFTAAPADALGCFSADVDGPVARDVRPLAAGERPGAGRTVLVYRMRSPEGVRWFNHTAYVDALNPDAIKAFIACTHEEYRKAVGREFGRTVPGIFTDEPNYGHFALKGPEVDRAYPWTGRLPEEFRRRRGYDLIARLPEISHRVEGARFSPVRRDYYQVATELYTEAYSRQIFEWCERHGLESTGHQLYEGTLEGQVGYVGACMPHYEWFQRPGIDILCDREPELLTVKQTVSAAGQFGRNRVLSELYGCTGWDATFEMYKHIGDWHQVLGVNHFCPHLSWYSMAGGAKRDYPASIFYQSPWWADHKLLGDYFARLSLALSQGQAVREVAVLHPIETAWGAYLENDKSLVQGYSQSLERLSGLLLDANFDFDFVDESLAARHAAVEPAAGGARLRVGKMSYRAVLVPECLTLRGTTLDLLERFAAGGGRLVFCGRRPELADGRPSDRVAGLAAGAECIPVAPRALAAALGETCRPARIEPCGSDWSSAAPRTWVHLRKTDAGELLFLVNMDRSRPAAVRVRWAGSGRLRAIDPLTGRMSDVPGVEGQEGRQVFPAELPPTGSRLFLRTPGKARRVALPAPRTEVARVALAAEWDCALDEPNGLTLDFARMRVAGPDGRFGPWRGRKLLWQHEDDLRRELGFPDNKQPKEQPYIWMKDLSPKSAAVELEFDVEVEAPPTGPVSLVLEHPERFAVSVNGTAVAAKPSGWFVDRSFEVVPLAGVRLRKGANRLLLRTEYRQHHWLEDVYLTGRFGVRVAGDRAFVTALPKRLRTGDWTAQGLAMYSGAVTYGQTVRVGKLARGQRAVLRLDRVAATVARVAVNGRSLGLLGWAPWEVDITRALKPGAANRVEITLVSSRRNLLGPLHHVWKRPPWTGPTEFRPREDRLQAAYNLVPYGLMGEAWVALEG
ncbi:MAG TPA: glycosyl hydrolase [Planctomycetota bacterium]|nr:glycosyl hydrolase [Planctomycetota bacterium]